MKLERLISDFLIPGDDAETRLLEFRLDYVGRHQADFSIAEVINAVKEVCSTSATTTCHASVQPLSSFLQLSHEIQRFCSVPRPNPFELVVETATEITYPGLAMDKVEGVAHPEEKNGCCRMTVAEDIIYNTLKIQYARIVGAPSM